MDKNKIFNHYCSKYKLLNYISWNKRQLISHTFFPLPPPLPQIDRAVTVGRWIKGMSADYQDVLENPGPQKGKPKVPKIVHF